MRKRNVKTRPNFDGHLNVTVVSGISFCSLNFINLANSTEVRVLSICGIKSVDKWTRKDLLQTPPHRHRQSGKEASSMPILKCKQGTKIHYAISSRRAVYFDSQYFDFWTFELKESARQINFNANARSMMPICLHCLNRGKLNQKICTKYF